jgi:hypothetical protein
LLLSLEACTGGVELPVSIGATGAAGETLETLMGRILFVGPTVTPFPQSDMKSIVKMRAIGARAGAW